MAGTYGSIASLPLCWLAVHLGQTYGAWVYGTFTGVVFLAGLLSVPLAEAYLGPRQDWHGRTKARDQNQIVIDETFGMLVACSPALWVHGNLAILIGGCVLFRIFDIVKCPPARSFDRMHSAFGVMMDDGIAGVYAALVLSLASGIFSILSAP